MTDLDRAKHLWLELLGKKGIQDSPLDLAAACQTTFRTSQRTPLILFPSSTEQVQSCIRIAQQCSVPVYPVSCGKNWGYGSRVPPVDGSVLLSLERMNRIIDFNEQLAYITIEAGVTQGQLMSFLQKGDYGLIFSKTDIDEGSLIGNTLERGIGRGRFPNRCEQIAALEVVLPTGELIHTGFRRFCHNPTAAVHRTGIGPDYTGLFCQSNLGIVTQMTLWLETIPKEFRYAQLSAKQDKIGEVIGSLRPLMARLPLSASFYFGLTKKSTDWMGVINVFSASTAEMQHTQAEVESNLVGKDKLRWSQKQGSKAFFEASSRRFDFLYRSPNQSESSNLDLNGCGLIWLAPALPFDPKTVVETINFLKKGTDDHGFKFILSLQSISKRCLYAVHRLVYNKADVNEDKRAQACHNYLLEGLIERGLLPYRLGIQDMGKLPSTCDDSDYFLQKLKAALDPHHILAPGWYE